MWYEILPAAGIIWVCLSLPHYSAYFINKLVVGNMFRRSLYTHQERMYYIRDRRLTDDPYKVTGLEAIPDN